MTGKNGLDEESTRMSTNQDSPLPDELPATRPPQVPLRFQFGLSTLFWITTGTAVVCSLTFSVPAIVAIPFMLFISVAVLPAVWTTVIIYGRGYRRTFGIGAMFPTGIGMYVAVSVVPFGMLRGNWGPSTDDEFWLRLAISAFWLSSLLVGAVCMGVRRILERRPPSQRS